MADAVVERAPEQGRDAQGTASADSAAKRRRALIIIGGVAAAVIVGVILYLLLNAGKESTDDANVDADVVPLAPHVAGQVAAVPVTENQSVKKGDVLLQIDDRDYQARVAQAAAELDSVQAQAQAADAQAAVAEASARGGLTQAQANLIGTGRSVSGARAQLEQARATLASRQSDLKLAESNVARANELQKANAIPQQQVDQAQAQFTSAEAGVSAAKAAVDAASDQLRRWQAQVNEAEGRVVVSRPVDASIAVAQANAAYQHARVRSSEASLALANLNLEWTRILAPDDGTVSRISAHPGALLGVGQTVAQFVPVRKYVTANFKETQIGKMHPGQEADVDVDTYGKTLHGRVESLSGGTGARFSLFPPDNASGNFVKVVQRVPVRIAWTQTPGELSLRAGLSA
ncbi:MAG: HlyD family secretion protein, partial [Myxococcaceae bacterium]